MTYLFWASLNGFLSVVIGAFGAHALKNTLDNYSLEIFKTGNQYQFWHAIVMLMLALQSKGDEGSTYSKAFLFFGIGTILFSGSLYALALTGIKPLGAITPVGGVCFLIAWFLLMKSGIK